MAACEDTLSARMPVAGIESRAPGAGLCDDAANRGSVGANLTDETRGLLNERMAQMAGHKRPSFLKKQKEQQRKVWATEKRAARAARRELKNTDGDVAGPEALDELMRDPGSPAEETGSETETTPEDATRP